VTGPQPGLAVERTVLAWTRTWLSVAVCGLLLLRLGTGSAPRVAACLAVSAVAMLVVTTTGRRRARTLRAHATPPAPLPPAPLPAAAVPPAAVPPTLIRPAAHAAATTAATTFLLALAAAVLVALH
jgi:hypothetical protein